MYLDGTSAQLLRRVTELERRMSNLVQIGKITDTDYPGARVQVTIGELVTGWLPWLTTRASGDISYWAPEIEEQVLVFSPYGELALGVVLPALYQNQYPAGIDTPEIHRTIYKDGTSIEYDRENKRLNATLSEGGVVNLVANGGVNITGNTHIDGTLTVTQDTKISGALTVEKDITGKKEVADSTRAMSGDRNIFNGHTHPHGDPIVPATTTKQ